jgi:hypothetical protein
MELRHNIVLWSVGKMVIGYQVKNDIGIIGSIAIVSVINLNDMGKLGDDNVIIFHPIDCPVPFLKKNISIFRYQRTINQSTYLRNTKSRGVRGGNIRR